MFNSERDSVQYYYRYHTLWLSSEQTLEIEIWFGMVRAITNHLLNLTKHLDHRSAIAVRWTVDDAIHEVLKLMNADDSVLFERCSPVILRSIVTAWVSEWDDYRSARVPKRPEFKQSKDEQAIWFLEPSAIDYRIDSFQLPGGTSTRINLTPPRIELPRKATAFMLARNKEGSYIFAALHERKTLEVHHNQDSEITKWGKRVLKTEHELRELRQRYRDNQHPKVKQAEATILTLRKITLHRLLRHREEKLMSNVLPFQQLKVVNL